jgi:sodium/hydrogen antiporter
MEPVSLVVVAILLGGYALLSRRLSHTVVSSAMFFVAGGYLVGDAGLGWVELTPQSTPLRVLAEATLTFVLFTDASRLRVGLLRKESQIPVRLLGIGLPLTIVLGAVVAMATFPSLLVAEAAVLAIVLAPTDAALGQAVVTDRRLPTRISQGLNVESGLNDGLCVPLLLLALGWLDTETGSAGLGGALTLVAQEIGFGVLAGAAAGAAGALGLRVASQHGLTEAQWQRVVPLSAAALSYGAADLVGGSGFIAAFVGGVTFGLLHRQADDGVTSLVDESGAVLDAVTFMALGAVLLGPALEAVDVRVAVYAVLSLTVVRMVPVALSLLGTGAQAATVAYTGWFGPRGLASVVFGVIIVDDGHLTHSDPVLTAIVVTILLSVVAHGMSAVPLTDRYVRWYERHAGPDSMESVSVTRRRWRRG